MGYGMHMPACSALYMADAGTYLAEAHQHRLRISAATRPMCNACKCACFGGESRSIGQSLPPYVAHQLLQRRGDWGGWGEEANSQRKRSQVDQADPSKAPRKRCVCVVARSPLLHLRRGSILSSGSEKHCCQVRPSLLHKGLSPLRERPLQVFVQLIAFSFN